MTDKNHVATAIIITEAYTGPDRRKATNELTELNATTIAATLALIASMTAEELLAVQKTHRQHSVSTKERKPLLSTEEKRKRKNEAQRLVRATPEGRAKANEASKKSLASKKRSDEIKALMAERVAQYFEKTVVNKKEIETGELK